MKNLIQFVSKNSFVFLFLFLQFLSFFLLVQNNNYQGSKFFNSSNFLVGNLYSTYNNWTDYFHLREINAELAEHNAKLQSSSMGSFAKLLNGFIQVNDTSYFQKYVYTSAKVVNNSTNKRTNYITIDKGSLNGIEAGMAVISSRGIVGKVFNVSENFSSIMSVLHNKSKVSCKIKKSGYFGPIVWNSSNYRIGELVDIPNHVQLSVGDTIVTSGYSDNFPEGILAGTIKSFESIEGSNFYNILVDFSVDYKAISHVFVVKCLTKGEQDKLEELNPMDNDE